MALRIPGSMCVRQLIALAFLMPLFLVFSYLLPTSDTGPVEFADAQLDRYEVDYSLRFNDDDSPSLSKTFTQVGSTTKWTFSTWVKRGTLGAQKYILNAGYDGSNYTSLGFSSSDSIQYLNAVGGSVTANKVTTAVFRDPAAWLHMVIAVDTSQGTAANRNRVYVNGTEITSFSTDTNHGSGNATWITDNNNNAGTNVVHYLGRDPYNAVYFDGLVSETHLIDGQQLTPSSFGYTDGNGYWRPKEYQGSSSGANSFFGTNGFRFNFASSTELGWNLASTTSFAARWSETNIDATDQLIDTPSHSFAELNPLRKGANITISNGDVQFTGSSGHYMARADFGMSSGKWYWEETVANGTSGSGAVNITGMVSNNTDITSTTLGYVGGTEASAGIGYSSDACNFYGIGFTSSGSCFNPPSAGTLGFAFDADAGKFWIRKSDGTWTQGDPAAGTSPSFTASAANVGVTMFPAHSLLNESGAQIYNFGRTANPTSTATTIPFRSSAGGYFYYDPPSGFKALSTANIADVAIQKPASYFEAKTYTGTGASLSVTGLGFTPDLVWIKNRTDISSHALFDAVRAVQKFLSTDSTAAEDTDDTQSVTSFDSTGFSLGTGASTANVNTSAKSYISWNWKESSTSGFDIVTYTGDNTANRDISHSLASAPDFAIVKRRDSTSDWFVWQSSMSSSSAFALLNTTAATSTTNSPWCTACASSNWGASTFRVTNNSTNNANASGGTYVAYLFDKISGFSDFGWYIGNASTDGPFVYTGFKPKYVVIKETTATANWVMRDNIRDTYNPAATVINPNTTAAEAAGGVGVDLLANGFKIRAATTPVNTSGGTFVYAAFAEQPFKLSATNRYPYLAGLFDPSGETIFTKAVSITGALSVQYQLSKGAGTFVIDHPLDPKNKLLYHSFVESPEQKNVYDGVVELDENGEAVVELPSYFLALNTDYRYLATPIGESMSDLHVEKEAGRRYWLFGPPTFRISGGTPNGRVSWQATGVRQDPYARDNPIIPEVEKGPEQLVEKGEYLHPEFYSQ